MSRKQFYVSKSQVSPYHITDITATPFLYVAEVVLVEVEASHPRLDFQAVELVAVETACHHRLDFQAEELVAVETALVEVQ